MSMGSAGTSTANPLGTISVPTWAASIPDSGFEELAPLRTINGLFVGSEGTQWWVIGKDFARDLTPELKQSLLAIGGAQLFQIRPDRSLVRFGQIVPTGQLPEMSWRPLAKCVVPELPVAGFACHQPSTFDLQLLPGNVVFEPTLIQLRLVDWVSYVDTAPKIRLDRLEFALASDHRVLVRGKPLPPVPGVRLCDYEGIFVPAGWSWSPPVEPAILRQLFKLSTDDCALWSPETQSWERLPADAFVPARREHVRQSSPTCSDTRSEVST